MQPAHCSSRGEAARPLIERLRLPTETTLAAFDATIWRHIPDRPVLRAILERFLARVLTTWRETVKDVPALGRPWPAGLRPDDVPWRARTRNALARAHQYTDVERLSWVTYGELLALRNMGVVSVLDFAATAEEAIDRFEAAERDAATKEELATEALQDIVGQDWAEIRRCL
jgi:hypothetical protein